MHWLVQDPRDVILHAFLLTGMILGFDFKELSSVTMDAFSCSYLGVEIVIPLQGKDCTKLVWHKVPLWPKKDLGVSSPMNPLVSIVTWDLTSRRQ